MWVRPSGEEVVVEVAGREEGGVGRGRSWVCCTEGGGRALRKTQFLYSVRA